MPVTDLLQIPVAADALLKSGLSAHQERIVLNYRRHVLLETTGLWEQIFVPEMTADHPVHRVNRSHESMVLDGREAISSFYAEKARDGGHVVVTDNEKLAVADWGVATELSLTKYVPARIAAAKGFPIADGDTGCYRIRSKVAMFWHYDDDVLLTGEHLYEDCESVHIDLVGDDQRITPEQALEVLLPVMNPAPQLCRNSINS